MPPPQSAFYFMNYLSVWFVSFLFSFTRDLKYYLKSVFHSGLDLTPIIFPVPLKMIFMTSKELFKLG